MPDPARDEVCISFADSSNQWNNKARLETIDMKPRRPTVSGPTIVDPTRFVANLSAIATAFALLSTSLGLPALAREAESFIYTSASGNAEPVESIPLLELLPMTLYYTAWLILEDRETIGAPVRF